MEARNKAVGALVVLVLFGQSSAVMNKGLQAPVQKQQIQADTFLPDGSVIETSEKEFGGLQSGVTMDAQGAMYHKYIEDGDKGEHMMEGADQVEEDGQDADAEDTGDDDDDQNQLPSIHMPDLWVEVPLENLENAKVMPRAPSTRDEDLTKENCFRRWKCLGYSRSTSSNKFFLLEKGDEKYKGGYFVTVKKKSSSAMSRFFTPMQSENEQPASVALNHSSYGEHAGCTEAFDDPSGASDGREFCASLCNYYHQCIGFWVTHKSGQQSGYGKCCLKASYTMFGDHDNTTKGMFLVKKGVIQSAQYLLIGEAPCVNNPWASFITFWPIVEGTGAERGASQQDCMAYCSMDSSCQGFTTKHHGASQVCYIFSPNRPFGFKWGSGFDGDLPDASPGTETATSVKPGFCYRKVM